MRSLFKSDLFFINFAKLSVKNTFMQSTDTILMIEPINFGYNPQTAVNNYFQINDKSKEIQKKALKEFSDFVEKLQNNGINVIKIKDTPVPHTPDSIFPNNWISFHEDGKVILYPMFAENRRNERRDDIFKILSNNNFYISQILDYSNFELESKFLEGTGSMVLDRENKIAYGAISPRLNEDVFRKFCFEFNYKPIIFHSYQNLNEIRLPIYHTNVMMCICTNFAIICLESIDDKTERKLVEKTISESGKKIIEISEYQMKNFAGNMLELTNLNNEKILVMSESAYKNLSEMQLKEIKNHADILYSRLENIERNGGGSARCMIAEIFLPKIH